MPASYDRIQPNTWSGAYLCWGMENREAPIRAACPPGTPDGSISNFEIKVFDGCANPYLGLASIIAAGIDGLRGHSTLPEPIGKTVILKTVISYLSNPVCTVLYAALQFTNSAYGKNLNDLPFGLYDIRELQ